MPSQSYKGISNRGHYLLAQQEDDTVDFKASLAGLSSDDLVAFANTENGGALLIGVSEDEDDKGLQTSVVSGCEIGDQAKMTILNRAASCMPPLEGVEVIFENTADKPFIRIEISPSKTRPHCTASGTYKIREDGRNRAIHPRTLLGIFLESESERFFSRFNQATTDLKDELSSLRTELAETRNALHTDD